MHKPFIETKRRSLLKAFSWRFLATIITSSIVWLLTREAKFAATVGLLDTTIKIFVYFIHERAWIRIPFGKKEISDYSI